jgi:hypothetical protein
LDLLIKDLEEVQKEPAAGNWKLADVIALCKQLHAKLVEYKNNPSVLPKLDPPQEPRRDGVDPKARAESAKNCSFRRALRLRDDEGRSLVAICATS